MVHKKFILAALAFGLAVAAFIVLSRGDRSRQPAPRKDTVEAARKFVSLPATSQQSRVIQEGDIPFSPGDHTLARVYDEISGRLRYQLEAKTWEPVSETDFHLQELLIQIFMPRGEITYISADEAQVTLARRSRNRVDPRNGWVRGNVKVVIDRTTAEWREANPDLADRYAHPNDLINIDMSDAKFDLERAELSSSGAILVDSSDVRIENVSGLMLQWDQVDNRIDVLRFEQGGKMTLRRGGKMVDFAMPGTQRDVIPASSQASGSGAEEPAPVGPAELGKLAVDSLVRDSVLAPLARRTVAANEMTAPAGVGGEVRHALAMKPMSIKTISADQAAAEIRLEGGIVKANRPREIPQTGPSPQPTTDRAYRLRTPEVLATDTQDLKKEAREGKAGAALEATALDALAAKKKKKIHTYRAAFSNQVVVEQMDGLRTIGKLEADKLELNFDFGDKQKSLSGTSRRDKDSAPTSAPASQKAFPPSQRRPDAESDLAALEQDRTKLILTWSGPLELRPLQVEGTEQTGQRFDAIATGAPVRVQSEQGTAACRQLVYRHERRQVWLAGSEAAPVELAVSASRRLLGREVFFDQKRGLAVVDGGGSMIDERKDSANKEGGDTLLDSLGRTSPLAGGESAKKRRAPVEIRWGRSVELELGFRPVERINPSTGLKERKQREFLQRAWFHGDVSIKQGDQQVGAREVAVTFGRPQGRDDLADYIQHLNMLGDVRLQRGKESITAQRLDAEMVLTASRRNIPHVVDAEGAVEVKQADREIRAEKMHVVLAEVQKSTAKPVTGDLPTFTDSRLGVESLEAEGGVFVNDPLQNLRIRKAQSLKCVMRDANQLLRATIASPGPDVYARVRYGDTAIHAGNINIELEDESVEVPGPGAAWMMTREDFTGRKLRKPAPVKITWTDEMRFRLAQNVGRFSGKVHSESQAFSLDCDELTIRFAKAPPVKEQRKEGLVERFYVLGEIVGGKARVKEVEPAAGVRDRKRPVYVAAEGNAQAMSCEYAPDRADGEPGMLLNRLWINGDKIAVDLAREQLSVPCRGSLLIEDYQFEAKGAQASLPPRARVDGGPLMSTVRDEGPSQTAVTWENSMDLFVDRGLVTFDKNVSMIHRSGQEMVLRRELSEAMKITPEQLQYLSKGRKASLSCGHLLLEFLTTEKNKAGSDTAAPAIRATDLKRLIAKQAVHLQEGTKSLMGDYLQYMHETSEVRLEGSTALEARIIDQDEQDQRLTMWRGPLLIWDRRTNHIEAPGAAIRASRR